MSRKVTAPVARSTAYDFNAQLAKCHLRHASSICDCMVEHAAYPESRDVMPHEILFATVQDVNNGDARLRCMSSLNGVKLNEQTIESVQNALRSCNCREELVQLFQNTTTSVQREPLLKWLDERTYREKSLLNNALTQNFVYIGVAITPCKAGDTSALQRQGFSATRGGLMTVMNTGRSIIAPGQKVRMVIDLRDLVANSRKFSEKIDGVPQQKILARLEPVDDTLTSTFDQILRNVNEQHVNVTLHEPVVLTPEMKYVAEAIQSSFTTL